MMESEPDASGARIGAIANEVAKFAITERGHAPGDVIDALAGLVGQMVALRAGSHEAFEAELHRVVGVLAAQARHRRQMQGGPVVAGRA